MSVSLSAERDRIQRQVEELEQILSATNTEQELLSSETGDESDDDDSQEEGRQSAAGLLAQREKIQKEIQNLENVLGPQSPTCLSDDDDDVSSSSEESELGLSMSAESCLQMNLVYQQVVQETLDQLETLLTHNHRLQKELLSQLSGPIKESSREQPAPSSFQQPIGMYLGRFLKPYFKDKLTGLGPPANQETKEKASRLTGCLDDKKLKMKRWGSWQKTLLINSIAKDSLRRLIQPKLSRVDYLSQKLSSAAETDRQQLRQQMDSLEKEIDLIRAKKEEELLGDRYDEHDWQKISNIDFEGTRDAEDIRSFWQNYLHPSINKTAWSKEEVHQLKEVSRRHVERNWETIAAELGTGRTAFLCLQTFQRFASDSLKRSSWTPDEDNLLKELVDKLRIGNFIPYTQMSYFMEGRDPAQLIYRWNQVLDPSLRKGTWTKEEDELLLQAVSHHGEKNWWKIRLEVPGRTDSSCRDRYYDCLKAGTKRGAFDQQEVELLLRLVDKHGVGRWAKIAAEIPNRYDAQCLREWRKLSRSAAAPVEKNKKKKKTSKSSGVQPKKKTKIRTKAAGTAKRSIRSRLMTLKEEEEEEEEEESSEDEGMVVEYMDSDEEEKKKKKKKKKEVVKAEKEYTFPPMQEWIPVEKAQAPFTFLSFRPVELPSSGVTHSRVRSTIVGQFGRSVIIGPAPRELQWGERHSSSTMMMVSPDQLRAHLRSQEHKFKTRSSGPRGRARTNDQNPLGRVTDKGIYYQLQAAVTPWIGNLLIPPKHRQTEADVLRERAEKTKLCSTPVFLLLLQTLNVDVVGCKEMIEQRRNKVVSLAPPQRPRSVRPNTVAGILQQKRAIKEELREFNQQHKLILKQLQELQQKQKQQLLGQQQPHLPHPHPPPCPTTPSQNCPRILLQMPPNMHPLMSPMSFPQAVFIPHPVTQPRAPSVQSPTALNTSPLAPPEPPPVGVDSSPSPPHPAPHSVTPVSVVSKPLNTTSTSSASLQQEAPPSTQNLITASPASSNKHVTVGSTPPSHHAPPSTSSSPRHLHYHPAPHPSSITSSSPKGRGQKVAVCSSQSGGDLGWAGDGVGGVSDRMIKEGRRVRTPSQKAKALQEATKAKAEAKKKAASSPRKRAQIQTIAPAPPQTLVPPHTVVSAPPQTVVAAPPQQVCTVPIQPIRQTPPCSLTSPPTAPQRPPPARVISCPLTKATPPSAPPPVAVSPSSSPLNATPAGSDRTVSSTQNPSLALPPSIQTNQHTASSWSSPTAPLPNDHDYTCFNLPSSHDGSNSIQLTPDSSPNTRPKAPPSRRKRGRREEQPSVTSSQEDKGVGGTGTGVIQEGRRIRTQTPKARAFQEAKAEANKKRTSPSSPRKKRCRKSRPKEEVVAQSQPMTPLPGICLLTDQSMWVMTPGGLVKLAASPPDTQQVCVPSAPLPALPSNNLNHQLATPRQITNGSLRSIAPHPPNPEPVPVGLPVLNQLSPFPVPPTCVSKPLPPGFILQPLSDPDSSPQPPLKVLLPYKGTFRADPAAPPPLRREALQFDPSLMFLESQKVVRDWLSGRGGVVVPGAGVALPYLPPFISSLCTLSALLRAKDSLTKSSLQLLSQGSEPRHSTTTPIPVDSTEMTSSPPPDLPDSTSDLRPAQDSEAPSVNSDLPQEDEEELVAVVRQLVAERFSGNPAYQLLKARFLSCFTIPALLATMQPIRERNMACPANEEEEEKEDEEDDEEVTELKKMKETGRRRRAERSVLLCDGSGAPANHFSGIITSTPGPDRTGSDQ
ncbi:snRNA-activating protein complex subunit 4 isoform X1 [Epinephelus fuscoguttatus]|uniref:snRNA-activating protein complex subunit 4 isoform X1 n=2 Tax=Epinephelus fuscoguttatus TaxID=293821 RepID=UPI0020D0CC90|nr:snRNA-activating protein complex subunit 4 isoform X1 [Epinephelus fuscoguttatus]